MAWGRAVMPAEDEMPWNLPELSRKHGELSCSNLSRKHGELPLASCSHGRGLDRESGMEPEPSMGTFSRRPGWWLALLGSGKPPEGPEQPIPESPWHRMEGRRSIQEGSAPEGGAEEMPSGRVWAPEEVKIGREGPEQLRG